MKWIIASTCIAVALFCVFGFLATFEPGVANAINFRVGYAGLGMSCLIIAARQFTTPNTPS